MTRLDLPPKLLGETSLYSADFTGLLSSGETITTATVEASTYSGTDPAPAGLLSGPAAISGTIVSQLLTGGVLGVMYEILFTAITSAGQTLQQVGYLAVVQGAP